MLDRLTMRHDAAMALSTAFTEMLGVRYPIALAPMGGSTGGALAAAVSRGGGFGVLGGGYGEEWLAREVPIVAGTESPWGVGFLTGGSMSPWWSVR